MATPDSFVIVGAGLAGAKAAQSLREQGFTGLVTLIGRELHRPYERPPLSKGYLNGADDRESVFVHPADWYDQNAVELRLGQVVTGIDRAAHQVTSAQGSPVVYDKLLLTTGSSSRRPPMPGADAIGVHYLRSLDDSDALRALLATSDRLVVVGGGWIGLEVTAAARQADVTVTVIVNGAVPLERALGPELGAVFVDLHREHDVDFRFNATVTAIRTQDGRAVGVELADGTVLDTDAVLMAVGAAPNTELAERAGLAVDNGVLVDAALRSSDPDIFVAGDLANAEHPFYQRRIRVEHWANALNQPTIATASMRGEVASYDELPYFYTDQYDLGMEYVGLAGPGDYDQLVFRGDVSGREFIAFWLRGGRILAGMNVNVWDVTDSIKALIRSRSVPDPARLADPDVSLESLL